VSDVLLAQDRVLSSARKALTDAGVKLPATAAAVVISDGSAAANAAQSQPQPALSKDQ
jgi:hypothetical protein